MSTTVRIEAAELPRTVVNVIEGDARRDDGFRRILTYIKLNVKIKIFSFELLLLLVFVNAKGHAKWCASFSVSILSS